MSVPEVITNYESKAYYFGFDTGNFETADWSAFDFSQVDPANITQSDAGYVADMKILKSYADAHQNSNVQTMTITSQTTQQTAETGNAQAGDTSTLLIIGVAVVLGFLILSD